MSFPARVVVLLDGEYVRMTLRGRLKRFPADQDVLEEVERVLAHEALEGLELYRVFYYTAEPLTGTATHPIDKSTVDFGRTPVFANNKRLIDRLENAPDVAVRRGTLAHQGWEIGTKALKELTAGKKKLVEAQDIVPKIQQKGVDMRMGLDIASLAIKRLVSTIVIVTGDSDLVPAMKLARREGLRVCLDTVGATHVRPELKIHADRVL